MKITDIFEKNEYTLSFEVFPPKTYDRFDSTRDATEKIAELHPAYMSVTFGAGGSGARYTLPIAANIEQKYGVPVIHHLTCVGSTAENIDERLVFMRMVGVENVLALRGDIPEGSDPSEWAFRHADALVSHIKSRGDFCVGGACYPEVHPEAASPEEDLVNLKRKADAGCDFLTTQLFFDNSFYLDFAERAASAGIGIPITAGIMPVTTAGQIKRIVSLSNSFVPDSLTATAEKYGDDPGSMREAGIDFAVGQIRGLLAAGVKRIHLYTMNSAYVAGRIHDAYMSMIPADGTASGRCGKRERQ